MADYAAIDGEPVGPWFTLFQLNRRRTVALGDLPFDAFGGRAWCDERERERDVVSFRS